MINYGGTKPLKKVIKKIIRSSYDSISFYVISSFTSFLALLPKSLRFKISSLCKFLYKDVYEYINDKTLISNNKKVVYFFTLTPHAREIYFAEYAKSLGYVVVIFSKGIIREENASYYDKQFRVKNLFALILISWLLKSERQQFFGLNGQLLYWLVKLRINPVIVDIYDTCEGIRNCSTAQRKMERYVIQNSDSIIHRDMRVGKLYSSIDRKFRRDILISDAPILRSKRTIPKAGDGDIHVVSSGWVDGKGNNILRTAKILCEAKIHVHIFYNPMQDANTIWAKKYSELEKITPYFHIESPVFGNKYIEKISGYDFGLSVFDDSIFGDDTWDYSKSYLASCGSSRVNDYISCGLGVIISPVLKFQIKMVESVSAPLVIADEGFYIAPKQKLLNARNNVNFQKIEYACKKQRKSQQKNIGILYENINS
jgi:hypothetical protein